MVRYILVVSTFSIYSLLSAQELSESAIYERCYAQLVSDRVAEDSLLNQVRSGQINGSEACVRLLDKARLRNNGRLQSEDDLVARRVLRNINNFHASWFTNRVFEDGGNCRRRTTYGLYDFTEPAMHITRTMFRNNTPFSEILTGNRSFRAIRTDMNPNLSPISNSALNAKDNLSYGLRVSNNGSPFYRRLSSVVNFTYAPQGELLGIENAPNDIVAPRTAKRNRSLNLYHSFGGGIIGTQTFLLLNVRESSSFKSDGGFHMARNWSQAILTDLLCRDIPAVREGDATPFVRANSSVNFRNSSRCVACHTTLDRMAGVVRNIEMDFTANRCTNNSPSAASALHVNYYPTNQSASEVWPSEPDNVYHRRPTQGVLYYRSYDGKLVNRSIASVEDLGRALVEENDLYVCAAKRYYQFLTGVTVSLRDLGDPLRPVELTEEDIRHRNQVIELGLKLKEHQDLKELVRSIVELPIYRQAYFNLD